MTSQGRRATSRRSPFMTVIWSRSKVVQASPWMTSAIAASHAASTPTRADPDDAGGQRPGHDARFQAVTDFVAFVGLAVGLVALHERLGSRTGRFGLFAFLAALAGVMTQGGNMWFDGFAGPWIAEVAPQELVAEKTINRARRGRVGCARDPHRPTRRHVLSRRTVSALIVFRPRHLNRDPRRKSSRPAHELRRHPHRSGPRGRSGRGFSARRVWRR